jgi:hypothetical protein
MNFPDSSSSVRRFSILFEVLVQRRTDMTTFRRLSELGMPYAQVQLGRANRRQIEEMITSGEMDDFFTNREEALAFFGGPDSMAEKMTVRQVAGYQSSVDAASIVFAHSAVDAAVSELCWISALADPTDWEPWINAKKVSLADIQTQEYAILRSQILQTYLEGFERESLITRSNRLFAICRPAESLEIVKGFRFNSSRLSEIDNLRHDIVHGLRWKKPADDTASDIEFLFNSASHLWGMLHYKYGLQIDVRHIVPDPLGGAL